jgi:histidyl-tRNA synthetase
MVKPSLSPPKGTKDWFGRETILRNHIRDTLRDVFERYGYDRLETPPFERRDALGLKGGGEIQKEVFSFQDQGKRDLALRFDQTVPLARYIASTPKLTFPFKRYVIGEVFRDGPTQPEQGRYRVFTQCDVDVLGIKEMSAEAELLALAQDSFRELGLGGIVVNINNRKLLDGILDYANVSDQARLRTIVALDKVDKIGLKGLESELTNLRLNDQSKSISDDTLQLATNAYRNTNNVVKAIESTEVKDSIIRDIGQFGYEEIKQRFLQGENSNSNLVTTLDQYSTSGPILLNKNSVSKIMGIASLDLDNEETYSRLQTLIKSKTGIEGLSEIRQLLDYSNALGFDFTKFNPTLARGLDYYTGTTLEVYLEDRSIVSSAILAGGRFDDMVGDFRGGEDIPAVGFSFGLERLAMIIGEKQEHPNTTRQIYLIPIGETQGQCLKIAHDLRNQGLNVDMELLKKRKLGKSIEYADNQGIPLIGIIGEDEISAGVVKVKNLATSKQTSIPIGNVKEFIDNTLE